VRRKAQVRSRLAEEAPCCMAMLESAMTPEAKIERFMQLDKLRAALEDLPALSNKIFLFRHLADLSHAEIAARLGVSIRTVERHLAKAMSRIRLRCAR
jgi:RNA polymerase sigma factor (sigma-70 family)